MTTPVPYPELGLASFDQLDTWTQSFLLAGSDPELLSYSGFAFEQNQNLPIYTVVGFNARKKLVPATVGLANTTFVENATVNAGGTGGTPGAVVVTGTTGTGTKFQANGIISAGGVLTSITSMQVEGVYTVNPTSLTAEPVTGGGLTGATLALTMETQETDTEVIVASFVTTQAMVTPVGNDTITAPVWFSGCFNIRALNYDSSFTTDQEKYRAFLGAPSPTQIIVRKRQSDT
jgi:hypothetical protein